MGWPLCCGFKVSRFGCAGHYSSQRGKGELKMQQSEIKPLDVAVSSSKSI